MLSGASSALSSAQITDDDDKNGKEKLALLSPLISEGIYEIRLPW